MKAFLSHSSIDKEFVREVAAKLGRLDCIFDENSFASGNDFRKEIEKHIDNSHVFVFFASKNSLESFWCRFELDQALFNKIRGKINAGIVYIIDSNAKHQDIPSWLTTALIKKESSPAVIARDIKSHLSRAADKLQWPIYLGRSHERELLEYTLNPVDGGNQPKVISIFGLPGVGRRSFIKNSIKDLYSLEKTVEIEIEAGDDINTLCAKLADIVEPYSCQDELKSIVNQIMSLSESEATDRAISNIENIVSSNELPVFYDAGGLVLDNACLPSYINRLISKIEASRNAYLVLILTRRISSDNAEKIECVPIEQLSNKAISQLLARLAQKSGINLSQKNNEDLTDYINGYPPAAYFAIKQSLIYSVEALVNDKRKLTQFSQKRFITHIQDHNLDNSDIHVLQVLSGFSPLPLRALLVLYPCSDTEAHDKIYGMIDCSLIRVVDGQLYRIADPIKGAINEVFGYAEKAVINKILPPLEDFIETVEDHHKLDLSRVLYRIGFMLQNDVARDRGIVLNADYIKLLEDFYHQRKYKEAIELGMTAVKHSPDSAKARTFLVKALIQEEKWVAAQEQIDSIYPVDEYRNIYYLQGFLERKKGDIKKAIEALEKSEKHGRKGFALYRELSHCYFMNNDLILADNYIQKALKIQPNNNQVIDMAVRIAIKSSSEDLAKRYIDQLELLDAQEYFQLRLSAFHLAFSRNELALNAARKSVEIGGNRFFSGRVQLIKALTKCRFFKEAEFELSSMNSDFPNSKNDIKLALKCGLELENEHPGIAFEILNGFVDKTCPQYQGIRKKCLERLVKDMSVSYQKRQEYQSELQYFEFAKEYSIEDIET